MLRTLLATLALLLFATSAVAAKRDMYEQAPGYRGIEFGAAKADGMKLLDDSRDPILIYTRRPETNKIGLGVVEPAQYYFHKEHGFYKMTVEFNSSQNDPVLDDIKRNFGQATQVLPMGPTELLIWLRPDHTVEMTRAKSGVSTLKIVSTRLASLVGDQ